MNKTEWQLDARRYCAALAPPAGRLAPILDFIWNYLGEPHTGSTGYYLSRFFGAMGMDGHRIPDPMKMANVEAAIALVQLDRLESLLASKQRVAQTYHEVLKGFPQLRFPQYEPGRVLARVVLEIPAGVDLTVFRHEANRQGVRTRMPYPLAPDAGEDSLAFSLSRRLVGVPCGPGLVAADIKHICTVLSRAVRCSRLRS